MLQRRRACGAMLIGITIAIGTAAHAQTYPSKPLRIVTSEPGGVADLTARLIAQGLSSGFHQPAIVDNRGGASGVIGIEIVARAPGDGYTLLVFSPSLWTLPLIQRTTYDTLRDFAPVTLAVTAPNLLLVHPSFPATSVKGLIALAKAKPGEYNYAAGSIGAASHLSGELFKSMAGVNIVRVPFRGTGPGLNAVIGGQVQMMFAGAGTAVPQVLAGRLRALAVTSAQPSVLFPELPTIASSGLPGYELETNTAMFAPVATPSAVLNRLQAEISHALHAPEVKQKLAAAGMEPVANTPAELAAKVKAEIARLGKVVKEAGIRAD
jgi:tripartite-type tricarboxylate transporter receptor subunit TctC